MHSIHGTIVVSRMEQRTMGVVMSLIPLRKRSSGCHRLEVVPCVWLLGVLGLDPCWLLLRQLLGAIPSMDISMHSC